jgi:hypothetical protein
MTLIAYKDGIIAADSQITSADIITYLDFDKHKLQDEVHFWFAGSVSDYPLLEDMWFKSKGKGDVNASAIVLCDGLLWFVAVDPDTGFWKTPLMLEHPYAIGSGAQFAFGAMDFGASAEESVKIAINRDTATGGTIRLYDLRLLTKEIEDGRRARVQAS